jgi:hypothetical protein
LIKHSQRWAPWIAVAVLVAGIVAYAVTKLSDSTPTAAPTHRAAPLAAVERKTAIEFIDTAVARKNLGRAWEIAAPELKENMSLAEWKTGTIPVVPYPVGQAVARLKVVSSFTDTAQIQVDFLPRTGSKTQAASFRLGLRNVDGKWLVSSWLPSAVVAPPKGQ